MRNLEILYKNKDIIAVNKDCGLPSQKDKSGDTDAMSLLSEKLTDVGEDGRLWLVHRLDRVVGGVLVFARNKSAAAKLSAIIKEEGGIGKEYIAVVDGEISASGTLVNYLYKDSSTNKAFVVDRERNGVKRAELEYTALESVSTEHGVKTLVKIRLKTGRFHQIRTQFSYRKNPVTCDKKYGSRDFGARFPALFSRRLSFDIGKEHIDVSALPDLSLYPWCLFGRDKY